jgi:hypothetical protein
MADKSMSTIIETLSPADTANDWLAEADVLATRLKTVARAHAEVRFAIGDWLNKYANRDSVYEVGEDKFQKPRKQLVDYASTAKRMPEDLRTFKLSFNHYRVVANTAQPDKFSYWLEHAERHRRACEDLRLSILAESEATEKVSVVISEDAYETLQSFADTHNSTVQELAGAWLQEKVSAEQAIALKQPASDSFKPSPWILNKRAEQAEREKQAQELHEAKFPKVPVAEFKRLWTAFLDADYLHKPLPATVHTVRQAEKRKQADVFEESGLLMCRELGLMTREETANAEKAAREEEMVKEAPLWEAYWKARQEGKSLEKPDRLQFQGYTQRCTKLVRDVLPKGSGMELLPFLKKAFGVQNLQEATVLQWEEALARLEGAPNAAAVYQIIKQRPDDWTSQS